MIFVALNEAADSGELLLVEGGLCRFHLRRDGVVTIREIVVLPAVRPRGVGGRLIGRVACLHPGAVLRATCPAGYAANEFWRALGFHIAVYRPPGGKLVLWELTSSTVPTGTLSSPPSP
jgi:GNAT superfamily N-acetyltransferase